MTSIINGIQGPFTQILHATFSYYAASNNLISQENTLIACRKMGVQPSLTQVLDMEVSTKSSNFSKGLQFHQFCTLIAILKSSKRPRRESSLSKPRRLLRSLSGTSKNCSVFLGGACNPTTWRAQTAIPFLKKHGISYYNPQVAEWHSSLMELENNAKENADVLLFVLDDCTRGIASIVEAAFLAGLGSNLILVHPNKCLPAPVMSPEDMLSEEESLSLQRSHIFLDDLIQRRGIPVFRSLSCGLEAVKNLAHNPGMCVRDLTEAEGAEPVRDSHVNVGETMETLYKVFHSFDSQRRERLNHQEVQMALNVVSKGKTLVAIDNNNNNGNTEKSRYFRYGSRSSDSGISEMSDDEYDEDDLETSLFVKTGEYDHCVNDNYYDFSAFCELYAERLAAVNGWTGLSLLVWLKALVSIPQKLWSWLRPPPKNPPRYGVFLGGTCAGSMWRLSVAKPILDRLGVTFYDPQKPCWSYGYLSSEAAAREECSVILFVITRESWSTSCLAEAAHHIGLGKRVVLYVEMFDPSDMRVTAENFSDNSPNLKTIGMSEAALKDYNRGRRYLLDLAARAGVPRMDTIESAVRRAAQMAKLD